ncbi:MAG: hypothetical protein ACJAVS_002076, partial [Paracoccaceae bacterium]
MNTPVDLVADDRPRRDSDPVGAGLLVSGALHGAVLVVALLGLDLFGVEPPEMLVVENVSLISAPEFDAAVSKAPDAPMLEAASLASPMAMSDTGPMSASADLAPLATDEFIYGDVADQELFPDLTAVLTPLARATVRPMQIASLVPARPSVGETPPAPMSRGMSSSPMTAPPGPQRMDGMRQSGSLKLDTAPPPPADRVAPKAEPRPETPNRADKKVTATAADSAAPPETPKDKALKAAAPDQAAEQLVTEADKPKLDADAAPQASSIPVGRP